MSSITCPVCGMTSYNPNDIEQKYCGNCHQFHDLLLRGEPMVIQTELLNKLTEEGLMLARHPDGGWLVFKTLTQGYADGENPQEAYLNYKDQKFAIIPETGQVARVTPTDKVRPIQ